MQAFLFILYSLLFSWLITYIPFFKKAPLNKWWLVSLFILKIVSGIIYAKYFALPQNINISDTWKYYHESIAETKWLLHNPVAFVTDLFHSNYKNSGNLFNNNSSYWNDLKSNSIIKLIALINVFTGSSYYADIIFFNFLFMFGPVALYRMSAPYFSYKKEWLLIPIFLLPSFMFWCSGVHKDGLLFSAMMLIIFIVKQQLDKCAFSIRSNLLLLLCCAVIFALRNFVLLLLMPALIAWILSEKLPAKKNIIFAGMYMLCLILFFSGKYISPALNFPEYVIAKQAEFNALTGGSKIDLPVLKSSFSSFVNFFPYAIDMAFLQPHISDVKSFTYIPAIAENILFLLLMAASVFIFFKKKNSIHPFTLLLIFFSVSLLLLTGFTVTFAGAVVRYKSIATPMLAAAFFLMCSYERKNTTTNELKK